MLTLNQIVFNIAENKGDTSDVLISRLRFTVLYYRAMFIRRDYSRNKHYPESILQELTLDMENIDSKFLRSKIKPPVPIRVKGSVFQYVGGIDRKTPYKFIYPEQEEYLNNNKFLCKPPAYSYIDGKITVHNISASKILIRSPFEDPFEVGKLTGTGCVDYNSDFPIPMDMIESITKGILSGELQVRDINADVADEIKM